MASILHNDGSIVLANNERIVMADTLRFIWEVKYVYHLESRQCHIAIFNLPFATIHLILIIFPYRSDSFFGGCIKNLEGTVA